MLPTGEREHHPTGKEIQKLLRILGAASVTAGPAIIDNVSAHIEPVPKSGYTDSLLSKISIPDIYQIATPNPPTGSREFSLREKPNSIDLTWTAGMSGQLFKYSRDGLTILTTLTGGISIFSDLGTQDTSCYVIISEGQINSNLNCIIKSSRTGNPPDINIKRILNAVTLGLTRHGNSDDSQLFILGATSETVPVPGSLSEITVNTSNPAFCGVFVAAQSTSSAVCAIDLQPASGLTPTPGKSETPTSTATRTTTATTTSTPISVSPTPSKTAIPVPTQPAYYTQFQSIESPEGGRILIKAGSLVRPEALTDAKNRALNRTSYRADERSSISRNLVEIAVIPEGISIQTLPDRIHQPQGDVSFADAPSGARGFQIGWIVAIAEENLLRLPSDRYSTEFGIDLFDHEFAGHIMEYYGITNQERARAVAIHSRLSVLSGFPANWSDISIWWDTFVREPEFFAENTRVYLKDANGATRVCAKDVDLCNLLRDIHGSR